MSAELKKICSVCHIEKPLTAFIHSNDRTPPYKQPCKECAKERSAAKRAQDPDKCREQVRLSARKHYPARKARRATDPEYLARHQIQARAASRRWRLRHPEKASAQIRVHAPIWRKANPEKVLAMTQRRRARKKNAPINDLTAAQWEEIKAAHGFRCAYCGRKMKRLTQDHITPLSKGGSHTASNVVPACKSCNSKKNAGPVLVPVQPLLLTLAPAKKSA